MVEANLNGQAQIPEVSLVQKRKKTSSTAKAKGNVGGQSDAEYVDTKLSRESEEAVCRICLMTESETIPEDPNEVNPLISPCKCTGTMKAIHLKCLRGWLETKCTRKQHKKAIIFKFKKVDCELCKVKFPFKIAFKHQIIDIVDVEKPDKDFIILESLFDEK